MPLSQTPTVSIVLCTYNGARYLHEQLQSLADQDYPHLELIVSDDCSTDDTWAMLQRWQQRLPALRLYRNEQNIGYNRNFETAMAKATGELIAISDQDDIWQLNKISKLVQAFTADDIVLVHGKSVPLVGSTIKYNHARLHYQFSGNDTRRCFIHNPIMGHDMIFRKTLLQSMPPFPEGFFYDWWLAVNATCTGRVAAVPDLLVYHRMHESNAFFNQKSPWKKKELQMVDALKQFRAITTMKPEYKEFLEALIAQIERHDALPGNGFDPVLFRFLYKNRRLFFGHKRRRLPELSYVKTAMKMAKRKFRR